MLLQPCEISYVYNKIYLELYNYSNIKENINV